MQHQQRPQGEQRLNVTEDTDNVTAADRGLTAPEEAATVFGERLAMAVAYAERLAGPGIERGLIGPREAPRLWHRHLLNSAVLSELIEQGASVADVGSGAGLPGIPLAIARPDLEIFLIEPLLRRSEFLRETVRELALDRVRVTRARAEELPTKASFDVVTARAVAPMARLAGLTLPLLRPGGRLLALKGESVSEELRESAASLEKMGAASWTVERAGTGVLQTPTRVAVVVAGRQRGQPQHAGRQRRNRR